MSWAATTMHPATGAEVAAATPTRSASSRYCRIWPDDGSLPDGGVEFMLSGKLPGVSPLEK